MAQSDTLPGSARTALAMTPWLSAVPAATLDALAEEAVLRHYPTGSIVFEQAETASFAEFVITGTVELLGVRDGNETLVELIPAVDILLPAAVLNRERYLLRARVRQAAHLLMIRAETFRQAVATDHALCLALLACQAAQFRRQIKQIKNVTLRSAEERVGCYLMQLLRASGTPTSARLPVEKRMIASRLGMTRETFSRTLNALRAHGLTVEGDLVTAHDLAAAEARFRFDPLIDGSEAIHPLPVGGG